MRGCWAKELLKSVRTYKLLVLTTVLVFFGLMIPLAAKCMPELVKSFLSERMSAELATPTASDPWAQFFRNMSQISLVVMLVACSTTMSSEYVKGSLTALLAKGLARGSVVLARFSAAVAFWTFCLWSFGVLLPAVVVADSVLFGSLCGSLLFAGGVFMLLLLAGMMPAAQEHGPLRLAAESMLIVGGHAAFADYATPVLASLLLAGGFLALGAAAFKRRVL